MKNLVLILALLVSQISFSQYLNSYSEYVKDVRTAQKVEDLLREGDLIFHESKSSQAAAIKEATRSNWTHVGVLVKKNNKWYVAEAISTVTTTPLKTWIKRGVNEDYVVKRVKASSLKMTSSVARKLRKEFEKMLGKKYDIYFEWADDKIYCSEYTWKAYQRATKVELGVVQTWGDLDTDGPEVQKLIRERLIPAGKQFKPSEKIITPVSQFNSKHLYLIYDSRQ